MARMKWTFDMRLLVSLLFDESDLSPDQRCHAFNVVFKDQIKAMGFTDGVSYPPINAQHFDKNNKMRNPQWVRVYSPTPTAHEQERRRVLQSRLDSVVSQGKSRTQLPISTPLSEDVPPTSGRSAAGPSKKRPADHQDDLHESPLPLSKRRAIGSWNPKSPPKSVVVRQSAQPKLLSKVATLKSPVKRRDGKTIIVRNDVELRVMVPAVSQHRAQPPLPKLLFRLWQEDRDDRDGRHGFWSRRHHRANALSGPPSAVSIDATDILNHMDRKYVPTPFISTSNRLIWMVQLAVKFLKTHSDSRWHVSVIDVDALDKRGIYWARPFHDEVRPSYGFSNGAGNYRGTYEFLIWQNIPEAAILHTFRMEDFITFASNDREVKQTLRLEVLYGKSSLAAKIATLSGQAVFLSPSAVNAMARLMRFFGVHKSRNYGHISAIVSGISEGWGLDIQWRSEQDWQQLANHFANQLDAIFDLRERQSIKFAFLDGVAWGLEDPNAKHTLRGIARKENKAKAVGLGSPSDILAHELDALKLALKLYEKAEQSSLRRYHAIEPATHASVDDLDLDEGEAEDDHMPYPEHIGRTRLADEDDGEEIVYGSAEDDEF